MENCLVTKLKEVVDNPNLLKLGEIAFQMKGITTTSGQNINLYANEPLVYKLDDGYYFNNLVNEGGYHEGGSTGLNQITIDASSSLFNFGYCIPSGYNGKLKVSPKYGITQIDDNQVDSGAILLTSSLDYLINLTDLIAHRKIEGNIAYLKNLTAMKNLGCQDCSRLNGELKNLPLSIEQILGGGSSIGGRVDDLGSHVNLTKLWINDTNSYGTIEGFVAAQVAAGRTSGTVAVDIHNTQVTYQGKHTSSNTQDLVWENGVITSFPVEFVEG